jgi:hypothetical protein
MFSDSKINGLELDTFVTGSTQAFKPSEIELCVDSDLKDSKGENEEAVRFSSIIVALLEEEADAHNSNFDKQVTLSGLKEVFRNNIENGTEYALARVCMFIGMIKGGSIKELYNRQELSRIDADLDISDHFEPSKEDYEAARSQVDKYELGSYDFRDADNLYFETEEETRANSYSLLWNL